MIWRSLFAILVKTPDANGIKLFIFFFFRNNYGISLCARSCVCACLVKESAGQGYAVFRLILEAPSMLMTLYAEIE